MHPLWTGRYGLNVLNMAAKPVRKLEDMQGLIMGSSGGANLVNYLKALGCSVEFVNVTDMFTTLQRKTIDGMAIPIEALVAFKLNEVVKTITNMNAGGATFIHVLRNETWNSFSPDIQKTITDMNPWIEDIQGKAWAATTDFGTATAKKSGIELIDLPPAERARWVAVGRGLEAEWAKSADGRGLPGTEMYKMVQQMLAAATPAAAK